MGDYTSMLSRAKVSLIKTVACGAIDAIVVLLAGCISNLCYGCSIVMWGVVKSEISL